MFHQLLVFLLLVTYLDCSNGSFFGRDRLSFYEHERHKRSQQPFCATRKPETCCLGDICCRVTVGDIQCCCDEACVRFHDCCPDYVQTCEASPCNTYSVLQNEDKRSADYTTDFEIDVPFSDHHLNNTWFRIKSDNGDQMPTKPPGINQCGTIFPIWLNGTLPATAELNTTRTVCVQTETNVCSDEILIEVQNCTEGFYVYRLQNTSENAAYCFGNGPVLCSDGLSSESGYFPGCTSSFPKEIISPVVEAVLTEGQSYNLPNYQQSPSLIPVFKCQFSQTVGVYVFDVYWYINGQDVISYKNIPFSDLDATSLKDSDWINSFQINMKVSCAIRIREKIGSLPSPFHKSEVFKAGIFPDKYEYTLLEGEFISIPLKATVPMGCISSHPDVLKSCYQNFYIYQPKYNDEGVKCVNNIVNRDIVFQSDFCGIRFGSTDWNETKHLKVYGFSDGLYNHQGRSTFIRFSTTSVEEVNVIWKNIKIPDIKVTVVDKDASLSNRLCQSYNDPHITTYDGRNYHYMNIGEYVFYRNDRGPYWVHALLTNCGYGWSGSACHCGIAIRSRQSLFVYRICKMVSRKEKYLLQQPHIEIQTCGENDMSVINNGGSYKVTLPTGTEISFSASYSDFISSLTIKPSIYDINEAKGLCGVPSPTKDPTDDFHHRTKGPIDNDQVFGDSWRIDPENYPNEQLFIPNPHFLSEFPTVEQDIPTNGKPANNFSLSSFCVCEGQENIADSELFTATCNLAESTEFCPPQIESYSDKPNNAFVTICYSNTNGDNDGHKIVRRSISDSDDVIDHVPLEYDDDVFNYTQIPKPEFRGNWTEEKANKTCFDRLKNAIPPEISDDVPTFSEEEYIQSCILDIKMTATDDFLDDTVNAVQTKTVVELSRNETLSLFKTDNKTESVLDFITSLLCPKNCSNNGNCQSGKCDCFEGFIKDDCSQKQPSTPTSISLPANGVCDTSSRGCKRTNVIGNFFSKDVWCKRKHFEVYNKTKKYTGNDDTIKADYRNDYLVSVSLVPLGRKKRSSSEKPMAEGYDLQFSNNGAEYGDPVSMLIFDQQCYDCDFTSNTCKPKATCPVTTDTPETVTEIVSTDSHLLEFIVGISCGLVLLSGIFIFLIWKVRMFESRQRTKNKNLEEKVDATGGSEMWTLYRGKNKPSRQLNLGRDQ